MPILDWIGKKSVINHDKEVPFRLLKRVDSLSVGESENLIIKGDNVVYDISSKPPSTIEWE